MGRAKFLLAKMTLSSEPSSAASKPDDDGPSNDMCTNQLQRKKDQPVNTIQNDSHRGEKEEAITIKDGEPEGQEKVIADSDSDTGDADGPREEATESNDGHPEKREEITAKNTGKEENPSNNQICHDREENSSTDRRRERRREAVAKLTSNNSTDHRPRESVCHSQTEIRITIPSIRLSFTEVEQLVPAINRLVPFTSRVALTLRSGGSGVRKVDQKEYQLLEMAAEAAIRWTHDSIQNSVKTSLHSLAFYCVCKDRRKGGSRYISARKLEDSLNTIHSSTFWYLTRLRNVLRSLLFDGPLFQEFCRNISMRIHTVAQSLRSHKKVYSTKDRKRLELVPCEIVAGHVWNLPREFHWIARQTKQGFGKHRMERFNSHVIKIVPVQLSEHTEWPDPSVPFRGSRKRKRRESKSQERN